MKNNTTQTEYLEKFKETLDEMYEITKRKNSDYSATSEDGRAFKNFDMVDIYFDGEVTTEQGILVRMLDKMTRIGNLLKKDVEASVDDEKITDTLEDLANYSIILKVYIETK